MKPYFSIVIPLFNKEKHIKPTIQNVLNQSFNDFEIIVVNDGSTDSSLEVVNSIKDSRLKIFSIKNQGVSFARNFGVSKINSDRIVFLDADDSWETHHLEDLFNLYQNYPDCGLYCTAYQKQLNTTIIPSTYNTIPKQDNWNGIVKDYFEASFINSIAWTSAVSIPKSAFMAVGGFNESITFGAGEDTDLWIKLALNYPVAFTNTVSATHNLFADNRISNSNTNKRQFINLDTYEAEALQNKSLKKYLDINRFAIAIQYKLAKNSAKFLSHKQKIDLRNLNSKQRFLLQCNRFVLVLLLHTKTLLHACNINLSAFKF
ncbi:glycosyltransferase family A protein [Formosa haliotis]|uniref:glycosyltransferase family A protein n=1 Tax=Formosa haliotis TaxID=1555194 RepID=UPI000826D827|nr:glycosyltransferase family A protein [Formosa haliotis]